MRSVLIYNFGRTKMDAGHLNSVCVLFPYVSSTNMEEETRLRAEWIDRHSSGQVTFMRCGNWP